MSEMPPRTPQTLEELLWYVREYQEGIYIRQERDGKYYTLSLAELEPKEWAHHVNRFIVRGTAPVRVLRPDERLRDIPPE